MTVLRIKNLWTQSFYMFGAFFESFKLIVDIGQAFGKRKT